MSVNVQRGVKPRAYRQERRAEAAAETRRRLLDAARAELTRRPLRRISIDAVAAAAGVARSTVYATFGSRGGLFDAVAEDMFMSGGMQGIADAFEQPDPIDVIEASFAIGSRMYARSRPVWHALGAMAAIDTSASGAMLRSEERRAAGMRDLALRLERRGLLGPGVDRATAEAQLLVMTSFAVFDLLTDSGLTPDEVTSWMLTATRRTLRLRRLGGEDL
jgi:AcrR family transcriptional regulator